MHRPTIVQELCIAVAERCKHIYTENGPVVFPCFCGENPLGEGGDWSPELEEVFQAILKDIR